MERSGRNAEPRVGKERKIVASGVHGGKRIIWRGRTGIVHYGYATIHPAYYFLHTGPFTQVRTKRTYEPQSHARVFLKERASTAVRVQRLCGRPAEGQGRNIGKIIRRKK